MALLRHRRIIGPSFPYVSTPASAGGGGWTPASLGSALRLWIKADTGTSVTGPLIDSIADQSGNAFNLTSTGTNRPTLNATGYNGLPSVDFVAASNTFLVSATDIAMSMGTASSWFYVGRMLTGTASFGRVAAYLGSADRVANAADFNGSNSVVAIERNAATNAIHGFQTTTSGVASAAVSLNTNMRVLMVYDGVNATLYINNVAVGGPTSEGFTLNSAGTVIIGNEIEASGGVPQPGLGGNGWDGPFNELLVTNTALSLSDRNSLDAYSIARVGA